SSSRRLATAGIVARVWTVSILSFTVFRSMLFVKTFYVLGEQSLQDIHMRHGLDVPEPPFELGQYLLLGGKGFRGPLHANDLDVHLPYLFDERPGQLGVFPDQHQSFLVDQRLSQLHSRSQLARRDIGHPAFPKSPYHRSGIWRWAAPNGEY